jgi:UDP-2,4-diacetamido-2,4,6-trideoxy-beta-L-altropyranose hydrolase
MKMEFIIRVDASTFIGTGHLFRCLALADELNHRGANIIFICKEEEGNLIGFIEKKGYSLYRLPRSIELAEDRELTKKILEDRSNCPDWLIIDHYDINISYESLLREHVKKIMIIDDLADRRHDCDLLLDQTYSKNDNRYNGLVPENCIQLLGPKYAILRPQFQKANENLRKRDGGVNRILVFMGGADSKNITSKVLRAIHMLGRSDIAIDVIIGNLNPYHDEIKILTSKIPNTSCHHNVENMAELILAADLCIGAGGTTTWERCCVGLPTITIILAENQKNILESLDKEGALINLGWYQNVTVNNIKEAIEGLIDNHQKVVSVSDKSRRLVDGKGVNRVCDTMISMVSDRNQYKLILENELDNKVVYKEDEVIANDVREIKPQIQTGEKDCNSVKRLSHPHHLLNGKNGTHQSESLKSNAINLAKAEIADINAIFEWRNHPDIRRYFFNANPISWNDHEQWFNRKLKDHNTAIYVACHIENKIGSIRFENKGEMINISVMLNPTYLGEGFGSKIIKLGVEKFIKDRSPKKHLIAEIKADNIASINAFKKAGFKEVI